MCASGSLRFSALVCNYYAKVANLLCFTTAQFVLCRLKGPVSREEYRFSGNCMWLILVMIALKGL